MPEMGLKGSVAIVTGAGALDDGIGNGRAASILLAREGTHVALLDLERAAAERTHAMIESEGGSSAVLACDVTDPKACERAVGDVVARWGGLDVLVNNVGVGGPRGTAIEVDLAAWELGLRINVTSMMLMAKYALPHMIRKGKGAIVNIASVAGLRGGHPNLLYATSKGAIVQMTQAMAANHGPDGVRVNCVAPGMVYSVMRLTEGSQNPNSDLLFCGFLHGTVALTVACARGKRWIDYQFLRAMLSDAAPHSGTQRLR